MTTTQIETDPHNRRRDLDFVSKRAKDSGFPLIFFPEDRFQIKLEDLPRNASNTSPSWKTHTISRTFLAHSDNDLRRKAVIGRAYDIQSHAAQGYYFAVREHIIESK